MRLSYDLVRIYHALVNSFNMSGWLEAHARKNGQPISFLRHLAVHSDLIKEMGFNHLLPTGVFPTGQLHKKGDGSPYAIADHLTLRPEVATWEEVEAVQEAGLKVLMDFVPIHTAWEVTKKSSEWYLRCACGGNDVHDACRDGIHCGGYWHEDLKKGISERRHYSDAAALDLSKEEVWQRHAETIRLFRKHGVDGVRCDSAEHVLSCSWERTWGREMPRDFLVELIQRNNDWMWVAECYSSQAACDLRSGSCMTYDVPQDPKEESWRDALAAQDSAIIQRAIARVASVFNDNSSPMPLIDCGTHDHPSPRRRYGDFMSAVAALTLLSPTAVVHLAGNEMEFDAWPDDLQESEALQKIEMVCRPQPLTRHHQVRWSDQGATEDFGQVFAHSRATVANLSGDVYWDGEITDGSDGWVGYTVCGHKMAYSVLANPTDRTITPSDFPGVVLTPKKYRLVHHEDGRVRMLHAEKLVKEETRGAIQDVEIWRNEEGNLILRGRANSFESGQRALRALEKIGSPVIWRVDVNY